jgi:hypothetical protein
LPSPLDKYILVTLMQMFMVGRTIEIRQGRIKKSIPFLSAIKNNLIMKLPIHVIIIEGIFESFRTVYFEFLYIKG